MLKKIFLDKNTQIVLKRKKCLRLKTNNKPNEDFQHFHDNFLKLILRT